MAGDSLLLRQLARRRQARTWRQAARADGIDQRVVKTALEATGAVAPQIGE